MKAALLRETGAPRGALACWDFAPGSDADEVVDTGPHRLHGRLVQGPKRAVRGARWSGDVFDWRQAPQQYAAVHFHRDDLTDAGWAVTTRLRLPAALRSGAYAVRVRGEGGGGDESLTGGRCRLPLFVRAPAPAAGGADRCGAVAVVFPTLTYLAYGNDRCALHGHNPEVLADCVIALEPTDVLLSRHPEWGLSLYDTHLDGSGVGVASRRRPIPTIQPTSGRGRPAKDRAAGTTPVTCCSSSGSSAKAWSGTRSPTRTCTRAAPMRSHVTAWC